MAITFALYDFKQRMQLIFMIIIVIDIVGHIIIQNRHNMDAVGRLCVDKLIYVIYRERYNLLSNLKSRFFSERDTEKKNIKAKKIRPQTHTSHFYSVDSIRNGYWIPSCANNFDHIARYSIPFMVILYISMSVLFNLMWWNWYELSSKMPMQTNVDCKQSISKPSSNHLFSRR